MFLRFEAVSYWADVYVNGRKIGSHEGGFTPFEIDATDAVRFGESNEVIVGVRDQTFYDVKGRRPYPWGSFWGGHITGIWQDVYLLWRPTVYISDVFIKTSVSQRVLAVDVTVTNAGKEAVEVDIGGEIRDWQGKKGFSARPTFELKMGKLTVPAGGDAKTTVREQWPDVKLWWPDDPHLYVLATTLRRGGELKDKCETRFGFREFTLPPEGGKFRLNGVTWTGRGDAWHFMGIPQMSPDFARAWYKMAREAHVNIIRLHAQVYPSYYLDVADEMGMLIVDETSLWGSALNFYYDEDFVRRARQHVRELVMRDRNHPSVVLWSVGNEIGYDPPGVNNAPSKDWVYATYAELAAEMRKLDPTRLVSCDGDGDLGGRLAIYSLHYPGPNRPQAKARTYTIGESGSMFYSSPSQVAYRIGERAYTSSLDRLEAVGLEAADLIEGYRKWAAYATPFNLQWYGLQPLPMEVRLTYHSLETPGVKPERIGAYSTTLNAGRDPNLPDFVPNPVFEHVKKAFVPIRFFVDQRGCSAYGGSPLARTLSVHNDVLHDSGLRLEWQVKMHGRTVDTGGVDMDMRAGEYRQVPVVLHLPTVRDITPALWRVVLREGKSVAFEEERRLIVYPRERPPIELHREVFLYDPNNRASSLAELVRVRGVEDVALVPHDSILVVGPAAISSRQAAQDIYDAMANGLRVLVLDDNTWPADPTGKWVLAGGSYRLAFAKTPKHPVLAGLTPSQLQYWAPTGEVGAKAFRGVPPCNLTPIVTCRDGEIAMAEVTAGRGRAMVCALPLAAMVEHEPAARELLVNSLIYLDQAEEPTWRSCGFHAEMSRRKSVALSSLGVPAAQKGDEVQVLILDGERKLDAGGLGQAHATLAAGGDVLVLHGRPQSEPWLSSLLGGTVKFTACDRVELIRASSTHELLRGFDLSDLYWLEERSAVNILPWGVDVEGVESEKLLVTSRTDWRRWVQRGENTKTASLLRSELEEKPRHCGMMLVPVGNGRLIFWQVPLDIGNDKSMRLMAQLLTNLGATVLRRKLSDDELAILNMDDEGYVCAWLALGPIDGDPEELWETGLADAEKEARPRVGALVKGLPWVPRWVGREWDLSDKRWFGQRENSCVYAAAYVYSGQDRTCRLLVGSDDYVKVWVNGRLVHANRAVRPLVADQDKVGPVGLNQGWNLIVVKVVNLTQHWGMSVRILGEDGQPIDDLQVKTEAPELRLVELSRDGWHARASVGSAELAVDGNPETRWTSGRPMDDSMWFEVDMRVSHKITRVVLDSSGSPGDYPREFVLEVSEDGRSWKSVAKSEQGEAAQERGVTVVTFEPQSARFLRIRQTGPEGCSGGLWWSIHELKVYSAQESGAEAGP